MSDFDPDAPELSYFLSHPAFAGLEGLNVLHITGDLIEMHSATQLNVLSDGDLVFNSPGRFGQQTETGANATVNTAGLVDSGIGSLVMAGGPIYSDAVLHQANLVSERLRRHPTWPWFRTSTRPWRQKPSHFSATIWSPASPAWT